MPRALLKQAGAQLVSQPPAPADRTSLGDGGNYISKRRATRCPLWVISGHTRREKSCPLYPRKRTFACTGACPLRANSGHGITSLDHVIGCHLQCQRYFETECFCSFEVDDQLELGRLPHRQFGWLFTFENSASVNPDLAIRDARINPVTDQPTRFRKFAEMVHRWYRMACGQADNLVASRVKKRPCDDDDRGNVLTFNSLERLVDRCIIADPKISNLQAKSVRCLAQITQLGVVGWEIRVEKSADYGNVWQQAHATAQAAWVPTWRLRWLFRGRFRPAVGRSLQVPI